MHPIIQPPAGPDLVFFGDSLTDNGNLYALGEGVITEEARNSIGGPGGRLSNGPVYAEYAAGVLGLATVENYALASARAVGTYTLGAVIESYGFTGDLLVPVDDPILDLDINLGGQVDRFVTDYAAGDLGGTTAFILIGANNYNDIDTAGSETLVLDAITMLIQVTGATLNAAAELAQAGVGSVVIATLPPAGFFPAIAEEAPLVQTLAGLIFDIHNAVITTGAEALTQRGLAVEVLDLGAMSRAILDDPGGFGLIAPLGETLQEGDPGVLADFDPDQVAFYDSLHPTTATHGILGAYVAHALENEVTILGDGDDVSTTDTGADLVLGYGGDDVVSTGDGADLGFGGSGNDRLTGGGGDDMLSGGGDNDRLVGNAGNDVLGGGAGNDLIAGSLGNDVLIDGNGTDLMAGGFGDDSFIFIEPALIGGAGGNAGDIVLGGAGTDTLYLVLSDETIATLDGDPAAALGIDASSVEEVVVLAGRAALDTLAGEAWFEAADMWGFV